MDTIWGFGGARFELDTTVDFTSAIGKLRFAQEATNRTAKAGNLKQIMRGWRPMLKIQLWNILDGDAADIVAVFDMISTANGNPITIYPRYDSTSSSDLNFDFVCTTDIEMIDLADIPVGQYIELEFTGSQRLNTIPTFIANPAVGIMADESGNTYVDDAGNLYEII